MKHISCFQSPAHSSRRAWVALGLLALTILLTPMRAANAAPLYTLVVTTLDDVSVVNCTLRDAIASANTNLATGACPAGVSGADTIAFSVTGTITLGSSLPAITDTLTIFGPPSGLAVSGNNSVRVMTVNSAITVNLQNLTIANGSDTFGGGIRNNGGIVNITNSTLAGNNASTGGGIRNDGGVVNITNSTVAGNNASANGGGVYNSGGTMSIADSTFSNNGAGANGGAIDNVAGTITIANSILSSNSTVFGGGGIATGTGSLVIINTTLYNNTTFNTFSSAPGGGIANFSGTSSLTNSTLSNNGADQGGGIYRLTGDVILQNTILASSTSGGNCVGGVTDGGNNIEDFNSCGLSASGSMSNTDPLLSPLGYYGGPTQTMGLLPGSPALNAANTLNCPPIDQRGIYRLLDAQCDIGAFEGTLRLYYLPFLIK